MRVYQLLSFTFLMSACLIISACKKKPIDPGNDPNFTIIANSDDGYGMYNRKVEVFGISIYAHRKVGDSKLLHTANILAQYLDNDENGIVDNPLVVSKIIENNASIGMKKSSSSWVRTPENAQDLYDSECLPVWHTNGQTGQFDATLEEVLHVITHSGYADVYPNQLGEMQGSDLCKAMDIARGGYYEDIPNNYPSTAWYTYDDNTCEYGCQATEYIYWALTSLLGAQINRLDEIEHEWKLNTADLVQNNDTSIYAILTDTVFKFPTTLPDGTYNH